MAMDKSVSGPTHDTLSQSDTDSPPRVQTKPSAASQSAERLPLLPTIESDREDSVDNVSIGDKLRSPRKVLNTIAVIAAIAAIAISLIESPQIRIFESIICYHYYEMVDPSEIRTVRDETGPGALGGVPEGLCKIDRVQSKLGLAEGYQLLLDGMTALALGIPFGMAADRYRRKPILVLGFLSLVIRDAWIQFVTWNWQTFDIKTTWFSTIHAVMGGGGIVISGLLLVVINDVAQTKVRAEAFMRVGAADLLPNILVPPTAAWLMNRSPWLPCFLGTFARICCCILILIVPETLPDGLAVRERSSSLSGALDEFPPMASLRIFLTRVLQHLSHPLDSCRRAIVLLIANYRSVLLIAMFSGHNLLASTHSIILQYCSKRYGLSLSTATLLITAFNAVKVFLLLIVVPVLGTTVKLMFRLSESDKDL